jgi:alpha-N-arabinofuranosidase
MRRLAAAPAWLALAMAGSAMAAAPVEPVKVTIDGNRRSDPVSRYQYGMFIEPIGNLVAHTLWAEMLDDRKFYFPVIPEARDVPPPANAEGRPGMVYRKWRPIGGDDAVSMDGNDP